MNEETQETFEEHTEEYLREEVFVSEEVRTFAENAFAHTSAEEPPLLEKIIVGILLGLVFLLPIFFLPISGVFLGFSKNLLLSSAVILTTLSALFLWMKKEVIVLPKNPIFGVLFFLIVVYAFSSLLSGSFYNSFFGSGGETTTSFELIFLSLSAFLFSIFFRTKERILYAFVAFFLSGLLVFLFQILHLIFPTGTAFAGLSASKTATLVGAWSDLGIFSGSIILLSLITLEKFPFLGAAARNALYFFLVLALFFYSISFFNGSWGILGVLALSLSIFFFFNQSKDISSEHILVMQKWLFSPSFLVAAISFLFVFVGPNVNNKLFAVLNIPPVQDVRPSFSGTYLVSRAFFEDKSIPSGKQSFFGIGPNRFFISWQKYRPKEVNHTPWWGVDFNEGAGTIPSAAVSSGFLGIVGWAFFLLFFFFYGLYGLRKSFVRTDTFTHFAALLSFISALYFWIVIFLNIASVAIFTFAFIFTGLFFGTLSVSGLPQVREYNYSKNARTGFALTVVLLLLLGSFLALGYHITKRDRSFFAYRNAVLAAGDGDFEKAEAEFQKAIRLVPSDAYYRSFSVLNSYRANQLLSRKDISPDELRAQFAANFRASVENANMSIQFDGANYQNWITLGNAYSLLVPLGIENVSKDAYTNAKGAYEQAMKRNPFNPQIPYMLAKLALSKTEPDDTIMYVKKAIDLKNDDADALALLGQTENNRGHYQEAVFALEKALQSVPDYANAKYFLGLSYFNLGRADDALKEFRDLEQLNPGHPEIRQIISNLQNGYAPFSVPVPQETPALLIASTTEKESALHKKR